MKGVHSKLSPWAKHLGSSCWPVDYFKKDTDRRERRMDSEFGEICYHSRVYLAYINSDAVFMFLILFPCYAATYLVATYTVSP